MRPNAGSGGITVGIVLLGLFMLGGTLGAPAAPRFPTTGARGPLVSTTPTTPSPVPPAVTATPTATTTPACAPAWRQVNSPNAGTGDNHLGAVAVVAADDVWAVGSYYSTSNIGQTLIEHWNGRTWSLVSSPSVVTGSNLLSGVAAVAANDIWAVGSAGPYMGARTLILHWNGRTWSAVPSPNIVTGDNMLYAVAAVAADDVWAVGSAGPYLSAQGVILHWNGNVWTVIPSPNIGSRTHLRDITAVAADDVWVVGTYADDTFSRPLILHWDGITWGVVPSPPVERSIASFLAAAAAIAPDDVWAVGHAVTASNWTEQTLIEHWNGSAWSIVPSPGGEATNNDLYGVAGTGPNDVWAVGYQTHSAGDLLQILHWDGTAWSALANPLPRDNWLHAVAARASNDVWVAGEFGTPPNPSGTLTLRYTCAEPPPPSPTPVTCPLPFSDVDLTHPFYPYIHCLYCLNIAGGYADNTFRPGNTVTRGQVAKFVSNAAGYADAIPPAQQSFSDVPPSDPFWLFIERARAHGVISGYSDGSFRPGATVTRGQMAKFVSNAAGYADAIPPAQQSFADVPPTDPFWLFVERARAHGVIGGYSDGTFRPGASVTRGQASKFISNAFFASCGPLR